MAFSRLLPILRGLLIDHERALGLLVEKEGALSLEDVDWIRTEATLKDPIIADYGCRSGVNAAALAQSEIHNAILGIEVAIRGLFV
jgi:hypothetical protein